MKRTINDNDLLAACSRTYDVLTLAAAFALFGLVGCVWYLALVVGVTR